jgi:hypothetical protein
MFRKLTTLLTAVVVIFAMMPVLAASAAASGSATLLGDTTVFPTATDPDVADLRTTDGITRRAFQIRVNNTQQAISLSGVGTTINAIRVTFPANVGSPRCPETGVPNGFTCVAFGQPGAEGIALSGGTILPGQNATFPFEGRVNAPSNSDRTDAFRVQVSDGTGFSTATGALNLTVRVLETLGQIGIAAVRDRVAPIDAVDRVTSGQAVTATYDVRNHAQQVLGITAALNPTARTTLQSFTQPAGNGGTSTATFGVDTTGVTSGTQVVGLQSAATAPNTTSNTIARNLTIDAPVALDVNNLASGVQRIIANGASVGLRVTSTKTNPPRVEPLATTVSLTSADFPTDAPVTGTASNQLAAGNQTFTLDFANVVVGFNSIRECMLGQRTQGCRADGLYPVNAVFTSTGFDSNGARVTYTETIEGLLLIDILGPFVDIVAGVTAYANTVAADRFKQGDTITISGTVRTASGSSTVPNDIDAASLVIKVGDTEVPGSYNAQTGTITASYAVPVNATNPTFGPEGYVPVNASISDVAGNPGQDTATLIVDNIRPSLTPSQTVDHDSNPATPELVQPLAYLVEGENYGQAEGSYVVRTAFRPGGGDIVPQLAEDVVTGGCSPTQWRVDNATVVDVLYWNGTRCTATSVAPPLDASAPPGSSINDRIIVVLEDIDPTALPINLTYADQGLGALDITRNPAIDAVRNPALREVATILNGLTPLLPNILSFERIDTEPADANPDGQYEPVGRSTRLGAPSFHFNTTDVQFTLTQVSVNDLLEFYDEATGAYLGRVRMGSNGEYTVTNQMLRDSVPNLLPAANQTKVVSLRFLREIPGQQALTSDLLNIALVYDLVAPGLAPISAEPVLRAAANGTSDVDVAFNEEIAAGTDDPMFWSALYRNLSAAPGDNPYIPYLTNNVSSGSDRTLRTLRIEAAPGSNVDAFEYEFLDFGSTGTFRYEDLAGNLIGGQVFVAQP